MRKLCVMPGDGIGKEVIPVAAAILQTVMPDLTVIEAPAGWETFEQTGASVPDTTLDTIRACGAALFGAVQSPTGGRVPGYRSAILTMRQTLALYANIRPIISIPPITPRDDIDMIIFRENTEGLYAGQEHGDGERAVAERVITRAASERIGRATLATMQAQQRRKLTIVHKANVLPLTDGLFRDSVRTIVDQYAKNGFAPVVDELLIDVACLKMLSDPTRYDVVVTTNLFGDILSDAAAHWAGGLGFAPSLNLGDGVAVAEPVHGSAPDIAGQGIANPIAAVLSAALLVRYVWQDGETATQIETAVKTAVQSDPSLLTPQPGGTEMIGRAIEQRL